jgi:LTXXQ motif family protein
MVEEIMSRHSIRYGAILLTSVAALAMPVAAQAFGRGGGGGGGHIGGGGFGGGHIGGFGGGHIGGFGGGHIGGLGGAHFGGARVGGLGGAHFGGAHFSGAHFGRANVGHFGHAGGHLAAGPHAGRVGALNHGAVEHGAQHGALEHGAQRGAVERGAERGNLGRGAERGGLANGERGGVGGRNFGMASRTATRMAARGGFSRDRWNRFRGGFGWAGPLFWPYAYDDIYDDAFWGYPYDPFWDYGYGDIYGALFSPYGYDDLAGYLGSYGYAGGGRVAARGNAHAAPAGQLAGQLGAMCGDDSKAVADYPTKRIEQLVAPLDQAQREALDELAEASVKAAQIIKTACPSSVPFTPIGRIEAMQARLAAMAQAIDVVHGPLDRFYASLSDEQKARLNAGRANDQTRPRSVVENCNAVTTETEWPGAQIERAVRPTAEEQASLNALGDTVKKAADELAASCPSELPATPPARLDAIAKRIDAMRHAVTEVRTALENFYNSLSDEQKAQFNMIGQPRAAQR